MKKISTSIIPTKQTFYNINNNKLVEWDQVKEKDIDLPAIATFSALGFMLNDDTFYKNIKSLKPARNYLLDKEDNIIDNLSEKIYEKIILYLYTI